ncbi:nitroreductase family protein [Pseudoclavibacter sp. 13-3]|uniref:nitroreductase family protein n=1 Tax=Pseudoclavibacter sp. 13-3 TaxID=2901228 RepID=UPI001E3DDBEC|nr:nitroreductase family protein [Pseudoclavibacter sp. 13-3]MCD7101617.1 nitroreductase family protein [Pseudoclavibacter sp. 13-3]
MSSTAASTDRHAVTDVDLAPAIAARWSPRSFDEHATVDESAIAAAIEAARWAPSAFNSQPWRFIIGRRGEDGQREAVFERVLPHLSSFNQQWAHRSGLLIVNAAYVEADGRALPTAAYDLGLAVANQTLQLRYDGYDTHQISGIDAGGLHDEFELPDEVQVFTVTVAGRHASPDQLDEGTREREVAPRVRRSRDELVLLSD